MSVSRRRGRWIFVLLEAVALMAIPLLGYAGFRTLLDTRTGTFVEDPGPDSPGWVALVDPSPVVGVVEMDGDAITGVAVIASIGATARGGAVILVPAELELDGGHPLSSLSPEDAVSAVGAAMQLRIPEVQIVDADRWETLLEGSSYVLNNPDPVPGDSGEVLYEVGSIEVSGRGASAFLGRTIDGADSLAALIRRELFWTEMLDSPPPGADDPLSRTVLSVANGPHEVVRLPMTRGGNGPPVVDGVLTEELIRRVVPFPTGDQPGQRFRVKLEDRTGEADLDAAARMLGRLGVEVVSISNGSVFDAAPTALRIEPGFQSTQDLKEEFPGIDVIEAVTASASDAVVLQLGPDHLDVLASLAG